ncbi:MAG: c-type cytochrome [Lewinella sp.]|nr:c-type cytochrome [Lewinella sp.]
MLEAGQFTAGDDQVVARFLTQCWRTDIQQRAIAWLGKQEGEGAPLDLKALAASQGSELKGRAVFQTYCQNCHQVNGKGIKFGPELSLIGDKLGKDALLSAIVYPSQGISFGYEGVRIDTEDGQKYQGYVESQTEDELTLRIMGGVQQKVEKKQVASRTLMAESLMTANLHRLMSAGELSDLLAYLSMLKAPQQSLSR